jgi:tetratricopeptide (TPR) repeat protein
MTGEAAATGGAPGPGIVAGDLVNTASRLQGVAPPGSVLVGEATRRATADAIAYEEAGEQLLKGKVAPVAAWRATSVLAMRGGARRRVALEPPFVGRDEELRLVKDLFHATVRESKPRLVTVIGQAGIGKSRLGWEFEKYIDGVTQTAYWHAGRSPSYGEGISFWALAEMVRERAGIAETDDPATARDELAACLAEWLTDAEERRWVEPRLAGLLGLDEMPPGQREEQFAAWRTFFERIADRDPVILVFKDLHWADAGLLEFIEHVLAWSKGHPIYVLAMTRPDLLERHPEWGTRVRNATTIALEPLSDEAMTELLAGLVPGLPEEAVSAIVARAEGVPLYAVETVRMLLDRGQLVAEEDAYSLSGPIDRLDVPETLHSLVAARIDANEPEDRSLLADGAVLGQSFTVAALAGTTGRSEDALQPGLDRLVRRELLIRDDDPRSPERGQYRFVQAVVREVAYETLAKADRRAKHLAAARYFESVGEEELSGVLATHYLEALRATPPGPEADALAAQARIALRAAAERATALHAWSVAVHHLSAALEITDDDAERVSLLLGLARASMRLIDPTTPDRAMEAAALADRLGDRASANRARALAAQYHSHVSRSAQALAVVEPVLEDLSEDEPGAGAVFAEAARAYMLHDRMAESVTYSERALRAAGPSRETYVVASALTTRGSALAGLGRRDEAVALLRGAVALADEAGHIDQALRARNNLLATAIEDLSLFAQIPTNDESVEIARRYGMAGHLALALHGRSDLRFWMGEWDGAREDLAESEELPLAEARQALTNGAYALIEAATGHEDAARERLAEADRLTGFIESLPQAVSMAILKSVTHLLLGEPSASLSAIEQASGGGSDVTLQEWHQAAAAALGDASAVTRARARTAGTATPGPVGRAVGHHGAAVDASIAGRWEEARTEYEQAIDGYRAMGYLVDAELTALAFDAYLGARFPEARRAGDDAAAWFAQRGGEHIQERYRAAFRGTPAPAPTAATGSGKAAPAPSEIESPR